MLLKSTDSLTKLAKSYNLITWNQLTGFVKNLPYGRNSNRSNLSLVLIEKKGTCSSKHALLKHLAYLNNLPDIKLMLGIYKMNGINTPKIGEVLNDSIIDYIPEAHCYLKINNDYFDYTSPTSDFNNIKNDILNEIEITPEQVAKFKIDYHKNFLKEWIKDYSISISFNELWKLREKCILKLSK